jgi:hypothetical protein
MPGSYHGKRERERERLCATLPNETEFQGCQKALKFIKVRWGRGSDTCKAWVAQLVLNKITKIISFSSCQNNLENH